MTDKQIIDWIIAHGLTATKRMVEKVWVEHSLGMHPQPDLRGAFRFALGKGWIKSEDTP